MLEAIVAQFLPYILLAIGALGAFLGYGHHKKKEGRAEIRAEQDQTKIKGMEDAREARHEIETLDDADVRERARKRMREHSR